MRDLILTDKKVPQVRRALIAGIDVASGARSKKTYYHSSEEQVAAVREHIAKMYAVGKELPLIIAAQKGTTGFYIQEAILNELEQTTLRGRNTVINPMDWDDDLLRDDALYACLRNLDTSAGIPYVLRMFASYRERGINNRRAKRLALSYIFGHRNLEFVSVKYREKLRRILTHVWGQKLTSAMLTIADSAFRGDGITDEKSREIASNNLLKYGQVYSEEHLFTIVLHIFAREVLVSERDNPIIAQFNTAHTDITDCKLVPEEVLVGIVSNPDHPQHDELWGDEAKRASTVKMLREKTKVETATQTTRKTKSDKKLGVKRDRKVEKVDDPIVLFKTQYENGATSNVANRLVELAQDARYTNFPFGNILVLVDRSQSMLGHRNESKNTPRAIVDFTQMVLLESAVDTRVEGFGWNIVSLAEALIRGLKSGKPDAVFVLSDGYENDYDGLFSEVVQAWHKLDGYTPVIHVSPVGSAEANAKARPLGDGITSMVATHKTLPMLIQARLLELDTRAWLMNAVEALHDGRSG